MPSIKHDFLFPRKVGHVNEALNICSLKCSQLSDVNRFRTNLWWSGSKGEFSILLPFSFEYAQNFLLRKRKSFWAQTLNWLLPKWGVLITLCHILVCEFTNKILRGTISVKGFVRTFTEVLLSIQSDTCLIFPSSTSYKFLTFLTYQQIHAATKEDENISNFPLIE